MNALTLDAAQTIMASALEYAGERNFKPLAVAVLDARGALKSFAAQEGTSLKRGDVAYGKAHGALALGIGGRALFRRAEGQAYFLTAVAQAAGPLIPVPGSVLIRDEQGSLLGAVGISGETSDGDEAAALAGVEAAGFVGDTGA